MYCSLFLGSECVAIKCLRRAHLQRPGYHHAGENEAFH